MQLAAVVISNNCNEEPEVLIIPERITENKKDPFEAEKKHLEKAYNDFLKEETDESPISISFDKCILDLEGLCGKIVKVNGDIWEFHVCYFEADPDILPKKPGIDVHDNLDSGEERILGISTVHITPEAVDVLSEITSADELEVIPYKEGCIVHIKDYEKLMECNFASCIKDCFTFAYTEGCNWIRLDPEAPERTGLLTYRKQWDAIGF